MRTMSFGFGAIILFFSTSNAAYSQGIQTNSVASSRFHGAQPQVLIGEDGLMERQKPASRRFGMVAAPDNQKFLYGEGIDTDLGKSTGNLCVSFRKKDTPTTESNVSIDGSFDFVQDRSTFNEYSSLSLGAAFPVKSIPVDLSFGSNSASYKSRFASHIVVSSIFYTTYETRKAHEPYLNKRGLALLNEGYGVFRLVCGDEFVVGKALGGELRGVFSYEATSLAEQNAMDAKLEAGTKKAKANADLTSEESQAFSNITARESLRVVGTTAKPASSSLSDVYQFYRDFQKTVSSEGNQRELFYETVDYIPLILEAKSKLTSMPASFDPQLAVAMNRLRELIQYRNDILYAHRNWIDFRPISNAYAMTLIGKINKEIEAVRAWGIQCVTKTFQVKNGNGQSCEKFAADVPQMNLQAIVPSNRPNATFPLEVFRTPCHQFTQIAASSDVTRILRISGNFIYGRNDESAPAAQSMNIRLRAPDGRISDRLYIGPMKVPAGYAVDAHTTDCPGTYWQDNKPGTAVFDLAPAMFADDTFEDFS